MLWCAPDVMRAKRSDTGAYRSSQYEDQIKMHSVEKFDGSMPVAATGLVKYFGSGDRRVAALRGVDLRVAAGELRAIIGASGSGKSTLLHLIAGLTTPTEGRVVIAGQDLAALNDRQLTLFRRRHLGLVFQAYNLVPTLTVQDNIQLPFLMERTGRVDQARVEEILEFLGLKDRRRHRPDQLSGGEQQRVAIGRALVTNPSVILADEPTGNLDSTNGRKLCELLRQLSRQQQRAVILVTHDPAVAAWADTVSVLKDGKIVRELTASDYPDAKTLGARFLEVMESPAPAVEALR